MPRLRLFLQLIAVGMVLVAATLSAATAAPAAARTACTVTDHRVIGLSGLIVTDEGFDSIADSNPDKSAIRVWLLNKACHVTGSISYPTSAYDPEDMALGRDGTIYVADIGDNNQARKTIAVWRIPPGSTHPHIYRYTYPDRAHDAEAMLLSADDAPIFVTKDVGIGEMFTPVGPGDPSGKPVKLRKVGAFDPPTTTTPNFLGFVGGMLVTGGANSRDRSMVALRTYADAYIWTVTGGDVVKAITTTKPRVLPLPNEPQGESIALDPSGKHLYTVSDQEAEPVHTPILEYTLPSDPRASTAPSLTPRAAVSIAPRSNTWSYALLIVVALLVAGVVLLTVRRRRTRS
ncbi:MAG TPA: hypothetical protein VGJ28_24005 [Micromonosporaceae bacterium]